MHLSDNMWGDSGTTIPVGEYHEELSLDESVWKETIDFLLTQGFNTVLAEIVHGVQMY